MRHERWQSAPQVEMKQYLFDHLTLTHHRKHSHPVLAIWANQQAGVPDFENDIPPFFERQLRGRRRRARRTQRIRWNTTVLDSMPLTAHFVGVPTVEFVLGVLGTCSGHRQFDLTNHPQLQLWMIMVTTCWRGWKSRQDSLLPEWIIKRTSLSADDSDEFPDHLKVISQIEFEN